MVDPIVPIDPVEPDPPTDPLPPVDPPADPPGPGPLPELPDAPVDDVIPRGVAWEAARPWVVALLTAQADQLATMQARLDDLDPPQEAP